jgi:hypothetical protein
VLELRIHYTKRMKRDTILKTYLALRRKQFFLAFRERVRIQPVGKAKPPYHKQVRKTIQGFKVMESGCDWEDVRTGASE